LKRQPFQYGNMKKITWFFSYLIEFVACSFCGWLYEILLEFVVYHRYADRGILHFPICPIYGFFGLILLVIFRKKNDILTVFIGSTILTTLLELGASYLLESIGYRPWDYSNWILHYEWRISLLSSLIFGALSVILIKAVHPLMRKMHEKAPDWLQCSIGFLLGSMILIDSVKILLLPILTLL